MEGLVVAKAETEVGDGGRKGREFLVKVEPKSEMGERGGGRGQRDDEVISISYLIVNIEMSMYGIVISM